MNRKLAPLEIVPTVGNTVAHHFHDIATPGKQDALLAIGRENHVFKFQRHRSRNSHSLLAGRLHVEAHLALALKLEHALVINAGQHHVLEALAQHVGIQFGVPLTDRLVIMVQDTDQSEREITCLAAIDIYRGLSRLASRRDFDMRKIRRVTGPGVRRGNVEAGIRLRHGLSL